MTPTSKYLPLHDEDSGITNLNARRRERELRALNHSVDIVIAFVCGALLFATIQLFTH